MAKPIASRFVPEVKMLDPADPMLAPQREPWWSPCRGMNTTLPAQLLSQQQLQWAENVGVHYGMLRTRAGVRNVGAAVSVVTEFNPTDLFTAEGNPTSLPAHTPTSGPFTWVNGSYASCPNFSTYSVTAPTNVARPPATGVWGADHTLTADIVTNILNPIVTAVDIVGTVMPTLNQTISVDFTIPSGMTKDGFLGILIGANANGSGGYVLTVGYFPSAGRQRIALWSRDSAGVMTLITQASFASGLFTFDVPATYTISYDGTTLTTPLGTQVVSIPTPGYCGLIACISGNGGADILKADNFNALATSPAPDITTVIEFTTSQGISYLLRMGLFGMQYFDGTNWNTVPGYSPSNLTVFDKFATTAFNNFLIFSDGVNGMWKYDPINGAAAVIPGAPSAKHLSTFAGRIVASNIKDTSGLNHPTRIQWSVKNSYSDWTGIGSGFEDLLSTPGGFIDEQTGVWPVNDYTAMVVRTNSIWQMVESGLATAAFKFERRYAGLGSKHRHSFAAVPGGIVGMFNDLNFYFVGETAVESIADDIRDPRWTRTSVRLSRDATNYPNLLVVGAYSQRQRKYTVALSARSAPVAATGGFTSALYQYDFDSKTWTYLSWPDNIHWIAYTSGTSIGLTIDSSTGTIDAAGSASIDSEVGTVPFGEQDALIGASGGTVYREDRTLYHDDLGSGAVVIAQRLMSGQVIATSPLDKVVLVGLRMLYQSSVAGNITLRIHVYDSGVEQTTDYVLPVVATVASDDTAIIGSRLTYVPVRATGYAIQFQLMNSLDGRVDVITVVPELEGKIDANAGR